jgi:hypothetical protein
MGAVSPEARARVEERKRAYYADNRERILERQRERYAEHREERAAKRRQFYAENRERLNEDRRRAHRKTLLAGYGLTPEAFADLLAIQDGRCAICRGPMVKPCVDHDHETGLVRGILCDPCNRGLGCFADDRERLQRALAYLGE